MKVFISWSGDLSREIARELFRWLKLVIQAAEPYMSERSIPSGRPWDADMSAALESTNFGILVVTPDNPEAPWINFEAGALAKAVAVSQVTPLLINLGPADLPATLSRFQARRFEKDEVRALVSDINKALPAKQVEEDDLRELFEAMWPRLEAAVEKAISNAASKGVDVAKPTVDQPRILEELLALARQQARILSDPDGPFGWASRDKGSDPTVRAIVSELETIAREAVKLWGKIRKVVADPNKITDLEKLTNWTAALSVFLREINSRVGILKAHSSIRTQREIFLPRYMSEGNIALHFVTTPAEETDVGDKKDE